MVDKEQIVEMRKAGKTFREIGEHFGITRQRAQQIYRETTNVSNEYFKFLSNYKKDEFFCCDLHHSMYCPECRGERCEDRIEYKLNPKGGNEKRIAEINKKLKEKCNEN